MERAARIHQYGAPEVLAVEPVEVTAPGPGEVRIRHKAIGLNFVEVYFRRGTFPVPAFPAILGNEAAGVVEAVGRDVRGVAVGDRVAYADGPLGSYATARLYPADLVVRIPDAISDAQAAASFLRGVTARSLLKEVVTLQPGDTVLFHAAAGGVGLLFAQWAHALGIRVIGTVSDESKAAVARAAGCFEVIKLQRGELRRARPHHHQWRRSGSCLRRSRPRHVPRFAADVATARHPGGVRQGIR